MLVHEVKAFRYCSDLANFDIVFVLECNTDLDVRLLIEDLVESWYQYPEEAGDRPLPEFVSDELARKNIQHSLYFGDEVDEDE